MGGVGNEEEAAARISAALGLTSYPLPVNETLQLCTWFKSRPASSGYLGEQAFLEPEKKSRHTLTCRVVWRSKIRVFACIYTYIPGILACSVFWTAKLRKIYTYM